MSHMEVDSDLVEDEDNFSNKSTDNSSDDDDADEEKIVELQKQIAASPYTYELHVELITLCKKLCDLDNLRAARERMNELFPLTPDLWLDWLQDEKNVADQISDEKEKAEQKENLTSLFERALKDYPSVKIWSDYVTFSIGKIGGTWKEEGLENTRQTFERALTSVGIHVTEGYMIWEAYREFERIYFLHLKDQESIDEDTKSKQSERIFDIYRRQLSVPLVDMDQTYAQFKELLGDEPFPPCVDYSYKKALLKLEKLQQYEEGLCKGDNEQYEAYKEYIAYEKAEGDPSRVQNIYERALIDHCLKDELWLEYTKYIDQVIKIKDISLLAHQRAIRNCPWNASLWASYGKAHERYEEPHDKTIEIFETALEKGFVKEEDFKELWFAYLDYLKRRIDKQKSESQEEIDFKEITDVFCRANLQMESYFWGSECEYALMKYCTFFNAKYKEDMGASRTLWRDVIDHGHKTEANVWLEFANFERLYGDGAHYRKILLQALSSANDYNETFVDLLITFEREEGTLETFEKAVAKCSTQMQLINQKRQKKLEESTSSPENDGKRRQSSKRPPRSSKHESFNKDDAKSPVQMDSEGFKIPPLPGKLPPAADHQDSPPERKKRPAEEDSHEDAKKRRVESTESHGMSVKHDSSKDYRSAFLSNLDYKITEDKIRDFISEVGEVEEVRLVKDYKGRSKGFCYVVFKSQESAIAALAKDREKLDGRDVYVSPCEDRKNNPAPQKQFKFGTGLEKNKLFIKGLPFATTKEDIENMFKKFGALKDVRLVTYRNGHSKGLAYVDFEDEGCASNAVMQLDGSQVMESVISVAISNPPPRKPRGSQFPSSVSISDSLGGGRGATRGPRGRGRTQLSLVPRSVVRQPVGNKKPSNGSIQNGQGSASTDSSTQETKPMSNSDFAKMMQK